MTRNGAAAGDTNTGAASVQVLDRAIALLSAIADSDHSLTALELARTCKLNRSTAWRILSTLEQHGMVERDAETGLRYVLGYFVNDLSSRTSHDSLVRVARPVLEQLAESSGELISLAVPQRFGIVYVDSVNQRFSQAPDWLQSVSPERMHRAGPIHASSAGKVFLAWLSARELDAALPSVLERYTDATVTDRNALKRELEAVRVQRYAVALGEYEEYTCAVSAPVLTGSDRLVAIINLFGPRQRLLRSRLRSLGEGLRAAGEEIASRLAERH